MSYGRIVPCTRNYNDETFSFLAATWNITEMTKYAEKHLKPQVCDREFVEAYHNNFLKQLIRINSDYVMSTDLSKPGLLAQISKNPSSSLLVDGNHRCVKAFKTREPFKVYVFDFETQLKFITNREGIQGIIKYNNSMGGA